MEHKCIFKSSIWKVFEVFVDYPLKIHYIKEISRKINLAPTSVKKHLKILQEKNIIQRKKGERFFGYIANREEDNFLFYKKIFNLIKINDSGLTNYLTNLLHPKTIILYGSYLRGEDIEKSDIDLLIVSKIKKTLKINKYEEILKRKIHIIIEKNIKNLHKNLRSEIKNGFVIQGYLKDE